MDRRGKRAMDRGRIVERGPNVQRLCRELATRTEADARGKARQTREWERNGGKESEKGRMKPTFEIPKSIITKSSTSDSGVRYKKLSGLISL